jgi:membrane-associated phospholipid phosphatase
MMANGVLTMSVPRTVGAGLLGALALAASIVRADSVLPPLPASDVSAPIAPAAVPVAPPSPSPVTPLPPPATPPAATYVSSRSYRELGQHFTLDPVADGVLTAAGFAFSGLLGLVLKTGEIKPPVPAVAVSSLLAIDRAAVTQKIDPHAATFSDIGLFSAVGFAALDPILSGFRDGWDAALVDAFMYAESGSLALMVTDFTKIAVRRPRPIDYMNCAGASNATTVPPGCTSTDLGLSFFSGHAATVSALGATATYIAFTRAPHTARPWITFGVATALTAFVSYERVRSGEHFPTDVIAGSVAGASIGVLVPHLHRHAQEAPPVWVGVSPLPGGGSFALNGLF